MLPQQTFYYDKGKPWHYAAFAIASAGFLILGAMRATDTGRVSLASIFPLLVLLPLAAIAFRGLYDRSPVLIIDADGIWFSAWKMTGPLPWRSVKSVQQITAVRGEPFIVMKTEADLSQRSRHLPVHSLRVSNLDIRHEDALRLVHDYWQAATTGAEATRAS